MEVGEDFFFFLSVATQLLPSLVYNIISSLSLQHGNYIEISNMSNFILEFEEDEEEELPNTTLQQSSSGSCTPGNGGNGSISNLMMLKKKRSHPGNPDPDAEVIALSPRALMATNRFVCEVCHKGFQRDQNLQLHRRGHNLPWKLKQRQVKKRVYVCPEPSCVHHEPSRALGDLTGIKKHFCRKHGEKKWKCDQCSKHYAVQSDWKAHSKICSSREYHCDCGTIFSRKDSFVTHRAFCDALSEENYRVNHSLPSMGGLLQGQAQDLFSSSVLISSSCSNTNSMTNLSISNHYSNNLVKASSLNSSGVSYSSNSKATFYLNTSQAHMSIGSSYMSATALLQKAAEMGSKMSDNLISPILLRGITGYAMSTRSSYGSGQDASSIVNNNVEPFRATTNGLYVGNQNAFENNLESRNVLGGVHMGGSERMTVDFLGVGPPRHPNVGKDRSCDGNMIGVRY